jgi:tetratricopeptide (TPR) repeat protein/transcriptional regulator with XRE-family HTH domain
VPVLVTLKVRVVLPDRSSVEAWKVMMGSDANGEAGGVFGPLLREHRGAAGLSQEELAQRSGLSVRAISDMERGHTARPFIRSVRMLADAMRLSGQAREQLLTAARTRAPGPGIVARSASHQAEAGSTAEVARQLPAAPRYFTGRTRELTALSALLAQHALSLQGPVVSVISGAAGVGKTTLAVQLAHQARSACPDGQLYVDLRGFGPSGRPAAPAEVIRLFLDVFRLPAEAIPVGLGAQAALYRSLTADRRVLVVLDNAHDEEQVRPLLPAGPGCVVLVTSRSELGGLAATNGARLLALEVLAEDEAWDMLAARLGQARLAAEPTAVSELIRFCSRLPLALAITAARSQARPDFPLTALAAELRDAAARLDGLDAGDPTASVRTTLLWSYQQLSSGAARMFRLLSLHPGPGITAAAAASLAGTGVPRSRQQLRELARCHLLTEYAPGRYAFHDLVRLYAAELGQAIDSAADRHTALARVLDHYLHTAYAAALEINPSRQPITLSPPRPGVSPERMATSRAALAWFQAEHGVLHAASVLAAEAGFDVHAWQLSWAMTDFLDHGGHWQEQLTLHRAALVAARRASGEAEQAAVRRMLAYTCARLGDYDEARDQLATCVQLCRHIGDRTGEALAQQTLGWVAERQERYSDALSHTEQALGLFRETRHWAGQGAALNNAGFYHSMLGHYQQARTYGQQALALYRDHGDRSHLAATLDSLGYAEHHLGCLSTAIDCYTEALGIVRELGERFPETEILSHLGDTRLAAGQPQEAAADWRQALKILADLEHPNTARIRAKLREIDAQSA